MSKAEVLWGTAAVGFGAERQTADALHTAGEVVVAASALGNCASRMRNVCQQATSEV